MEYLAIRIEAADRSNTIHSYLVELVLRILARDSVSCMSPNSLTRDDTDLISRVRCGSCFSNATDIASGLSAGLASGLGWSLTTRQLLLVHNIANTDWG